MKLMYRYGGQNVAEMSFKTLKQQRKWAAAAA